MPLHPAAKTILEQMEAMMGPPLGTLSPQETRESMKARMAAMPAADPEPVHEVSNRTVPGPAGQIPVRIYRPSTDQNLPVLVWYHGGGWVLGDLDGSDATCRSMANKAGCVVVSVDYRLAPEAHFPAAADDCYAATRWVAENAAELGVNPAKLAVGGDSAGGNLAAVVSLMARDGGGPAIVHQALVYPVTNHDYATPSYADNAEGYLLTRDSMVWFWDHYLGPGGDGSNPYASPLQASNLAGLPPAHVTTAEFDPLRDEGEAYAEALRQAGVKATCTRYDGMIHGFYGMAAMLEDGAKAVDENVAHLKAAFGA